MFNGIISSLADLTDKIAVFAYLTDKITLFACLTDKVTVVGYLNTKAAVIYLQNQMSAGNIKICGCLMQPFVTKNMVIKAIICNDPRLIRVMRSIRATTFKITSKGEGMKSDKSNKMMT